MLTFQQYRPYDTAPYYAPCLPAALAYLPVFQNRGPLTLSQVSELASDYGRVRRHAERDLRRRPAG